MFKKIWNDPVGSKLIASAITAAVCYTAVQLHRLYKHISFIESWNAFRQYSILVIVFLIAVFIVIRTYRLNVKKSNKKIRDEDVFPELKKGNIRLIGKIQTKTFGINRNRC